MEFAFEFRRQSKYERRCMNWFRCLLVFFALHAQVMQYTTTEGIEIKSQRMLCNVNSLVFRKQTQVCMIFKSGYSRLDNGFRRPDHLLYIKKSLAETTRLNANPNAHSVICLVNCFGSVEKIWIETLKWISNSSPSRYWH